MHKSILLNIKNLFIIEWYNNSYVAVSTYNKMVLSESDTDSDDVLFEHRKSKSGSHIRNGKSRNGFIKVGSRVKT